MNDFTREELQEIVDMANETNTGSQGHGLGLHFDIRDKIQYMIDSYCEHEWINGVYCDKCGANR